MKASKTQRYCRSCGFDLKVISQAMSGKQPASGTDDAREATEQTKKKFMGCGLVTMMSGIVLIISLAVIVKAISKVAPDIEQFMQEITVLGAAIVLAGVGLMIYSAFMTGGRARP
jgi:hypothetical protein